MVIFFDIDGTLVGEDGRTMPESAKRAIQRARKNGHICMINTGRTLALVGEEITGQTEFDGLALGCGTMILYRGKTLFHRVFTAEESQRIIDGLHRYQIDACLEGKENNYLEAEERILTETFRSFLRRFAGYGYDSYSAAVGRFDKLYAYADEGKRMDAFREEFGDWLDFVDRRGGYFEIMPKGCSKASAVELVARELGVSMEETVAIGDSSNDIPMLERAHVGIAMGNATEDVKRIADFVSTSVEEDGISRALEWLGVIRHINL